MQAVLDSQGVGDAIASAIGEVDAQLAERIGADGIAALRRGLVALCDIRDAREARESSHG